MKAINRKRLQGKDLNYSEWCSINSYKGWLKHCDSYRLQMKYLQPLEGYAQNYYLQNIKKKGWIFMVDYGRISSTVRPEPQVIDEFSVWINTDIQEVEVTHEDDTHIEYEFNQVRYSKDEYIKIIDDKNANLETQLTDTQIALCEVYELMI